MWCVVVSMARHDPHHIVGMEGCDGGDGIDVCVCLCEAAYETSTDGATVGSTGPHTTHHRLRSL